MHNSYNIYIFFIILDEIAFMKILLIVYSFMKLYQINHITSQFEVNFFFIYNEYSEQSLAIHEILKINILS
jgi:hypothetical protein